MIQTHLRPMNKDKLQTTEAVVEAQGDRESTVRGYSTVDAYHWQQQGIASKAPRGAKILAFRLGGNPANIATMMAHSDERPPVDLGDKEVVLWAQDTVIHVQPNGTVRIHGDVRVSGDVITDKGVSLNNHTHPQNSGNHFGGGTNTSPPNA